MNLRKLLLSAFVALTLFPALAHATPAQITGLPLNRYGREADPVYVVCVTQAGAWEGCSGSGGGGGAVTGAASSFADGWNLTEGAKADAAWAGSGSGSMVAILKAIYSGVSGAIPAGSNTIGAVNQGTSPWVTNPTSDTHGQCSALCANLVVKASTGVLKTFEISADSTLSAAIWYVMVYDATSAPVDGAVTPAKCYQQASGTTQMGGTLAGGTSYLTGITIGVSTTGCFSKTASTHAFIAADYQ